MLNRLFHLRSHQTTIRTEILAGVTTFLTMSYIIFINPAILAQTKGLNNQPDPMMPATADDNKVMVLTDLDNVIANPSIF